ncbi:uncharacterized protein LOC132953651, partial [Metopolophium dirhodum]|uniref:uncharacterized protein LOC132953651 n=1 Tax=Metopolophium dirhodum TaxID=44670 RepID=UPI002990005C
CLEFTRCVVRAHCLFSDSIVNESQLSVVTVSWEQTASLIMDEADKRSIEKQSTANKLAKRCEMLRNHEDVSGGLTITLAVGSGQVEMRRGRRSTRRRQKRHRSRSRSSRRRDRRRSVSGTEEKYEGDDYDMTTDTKEGDDDSSTVDTTSSQEGDGRAVGDVAFNIKPVVVTTTITPTQMTPMQRPTQTLRRPSAAVVAFSQQQAPSAEILVEADVTREGGEGVGPRLDGNRGARRGGEEGEVVVVTVSPQANGILGHICITSNSAEPDTADSTQGDA